MNCDTHILKALPSRLPAGNISQPQYFGIEHRRVTQPQDRTPLLLLREWVEMLHGERDAGAQEIRQRARSAVLTDGARGGTLQREAAAATSARDGAPALRKRALSRARV